MKQIVITALAALVAACACAAPAPYPITVNSRSESIPELTVYRAGEQVYDLTFKDGATASDLTGHSVWMSWSTSNTATSVSTSTVAILVATSGTARATFSATSMNYSPGRYVYEVGVISNSSTRVYRQGVLIIRGSPFATGASPIVLGTNINWAQVSQYLNTSSYGPVRAGSNISLTTNVDGSVTMATSAGGDITAVTVSGGILSGGGTSGDATNTLTTNALITALSGQYATAAQGVSATNAETIVLAHTNATGTNVHGLGSVAVYDVEDIVNASATYYVWGSVAGTVTNPASKLAQLASPVSQGIWTSTVSSVTNDMPAGYATVKTNEVPRVLLRQQITGRISIVRDGNALAHTMRAYCRVLESDGLTIVQEFMGSTFVVTTAKASVPFDVSITNDVNITDTSRMIVFYFRTVAGWAGSETISVYSQDGELTQVSLASASGVSVSSADFATHTNATGTAVHGLDITEPVFRGSTTTAGVQRVATFQQTNDADSYFRMYGGATTNQRFYLVWYDWTGQNRTWMNGVNADRHYILFDVDAVVHRFVGTRDAGTHLQSCGTSAVSVNAYNEANSGTGGFAVYSGSTNSVVWAQMRSDGLTVRTGGILVDPNTAATAYLRLDGGATATVDNAYVYFASLGSDKYFMGNRGSDNLFRLYSYIRTNDIFTVTASSGTTAFKYPVSIQGTNIGNAAFSNGTQFASAADGVAATNAQQRVGVVETNAATIAALAAVSNAPAWEPYKVTFAASNDLSTAYDYQYISLCGQTAMTLWLPNAASNKHWSILVDIDPCTNSITITNIVGTGLRLATNPAVSIPASQVTPVLFQKAYNSTNWDVFSIRP